MLATLDHRGPDGRRLLVSTSRVLGHQHFWTTPEELGERQPLSDAGLGIDLAFDGRLDNREELLAALDESNRSISDAALVLRAYSRWSDACFERFLGSFAVVVHDTLRNRIVAARDPLGTRSLFYRITSDLVLVASEEVALLAHPAVSSTLDEEVLAEFFAVDVPMGGATFFREVRELLPAEVMVVSRDTHVTRRFWTPDPSRRLDRGSDGEYAEEFRRLLKESVRCRLRTVGPPGVMMSGGMDSPSIAALAATHFAARETGRLMTFSWVFDELVECDERRWIVPLVDRFGLDSTFVRGDDAWPLRDLQRWPVDKCRPWSNAYRLLKARLYEAAGKRGCRTLLNGAFSDCFYAGYEDWMTDLVCDGRLGTAAFEALRTARRGLRGLAGNAGIRRLGRRMLLRTRPDIERDARQIPWLTPYARSLLRESRGTIRSLAEMARRPDQYECLLGSALESETAERLPSGAGPIDVRDPFLDRRLVEFVLAVPAHQLYSRGRTKHVLREAMTGLLPAEILERTESTPLTPLFNRGLLEREVETMRGLLSKKDALWKRFVSADWLSDAYPRRMREMLDGPGTLVPWQCASAQLWSDEMEQRPPARVRLPQIETIQSSQP
ncbi:MAG: asparagine synthase-related protein [Thermoanaerobaculia bacterium]